MVNWPGWPVSNQASWQAWPLLCTVENLWYVYVKWNHCWITWSSWSISINVCFFVLLMAFYTNINDHFQWHCLCFFFNVSVHCRDCLKVYHPGCVEDDVSFFETRERWTCSKPYFNYDILGFGVYCHFCENLCLSSMARIW